MSRRGGLLLLLAVCVLLALRLARELAAGRDLLGAAAIALLIPGYAEYAGRHARLVPGVW